MISSTNPATGETLRAYPALSPGALEEKLALARQTFMSHRQTSFAQRTAWMHRAAQILDDERETLARIMTEEVGKTLQSSRDEITKCALALRFFADHAQGFLADEPLSISAGKSFVRYQPLGPILAIMPWNFPLWQVVRFAAPALMAGNVGLLKPAETVPACALALETVFVRAGFPPGAFQTLLVETEAVAGIIGDPRVAAATLTGSEAAGRAVAAQCGAALKPIVLELGGSDPFVVLPSADIAEAVRVGVQARTQNNGQSCIAAKRFIIHRDVYDDFAKRCAQSMAALKVGDPRHPDTQVGPLHTARARETLHRQVQDSIAGGARLLTGGQKGEGAGFFYAPTVLCDVSPGMPAYSEELFGPVAVLLRADDTGHAIALANDTQFGLGASVWSAEGAEQERLVNELECGMVFVNSMVSSSPSLPFGGIKASGFGRELSVPGIRAFVNAKTVSLGAAKRAPALAGE